MAEMVLRQKSLGKSGGAAMVKKQTPGEGSPGVEGGGVGPGSPYLNVAR